MACEVCQHCDTSVEPGDAAVRDGCSYHRQCHKCYVCGEIDLRGAETFRGVIFCAGCSQRIFQGCSTARRPRSVRGRGRRRRRHGDRVLAMANGESDSRSSASVKSKRKIQKPPVLSPPLKGTNTNDQSLKKISSERGTTTYVTQEILARAKDHQIARTTVTTPVKPRKKRKTHKRKHIKKECSDLRIAELGASVEIAHVALRNQSEMPVIIKSETDLRHMRSPTLSILNQESDVSGDSNARWKESLYSTEKDSIHWRHRTIGSLLKIPLRYFKRNILDRSSFISFKSSEPQEGCAFKKIQMLFNEHATDHQRHGLKKLYSTINRKNAPCKLGWLHLNKNKKSENERCHDTTKCVKRCKHFKASPSYRCMREQVMRLAGPTRSELAILRGKILNVVSPNIVKNIINYNKKYEAIMSKQANRRE